MAARISGTWVWKTSWTSPDRTSRTSAGRRLGEGFDQPKQVLVRAQAADIEQDSARLAGIAEPAQDGVGLGLAGRGAGRSGRGPR